MNQPIQTERAAALRTIDLISRKGNLAELTGSPEGRLLTRLIPRGWYDLEKCNYCRLLDLEFGSASEPGAHRISPKETEANTQEMERELFANARPKDLSWLVHHRMAAGMLLPALRKIILKCATAQTMANQAAIACGLERYRLMNGKLPEKLSDLPPQFLARLPQDVLTGGPYKYRRGDDGQFVLYSVGWNETDEDGRPGKNLFDDKQGDWVWEYAAASQ